jgi:hypothetical protein
MIRRCEPIGEGRGRSCAELRAAELLVRCRTERIEPPVAGRIDRIVRFALHEAEQALTARIVDRLPVDVDSRLRTPVAAEVPGDGAGDSVYRGRIQNCIRHRNGPPSLMGA